jgi:hypothetical protein
MDDQKAGVTTAMTTAASAAAMHAGSRCSLKELQELLLLLARLLQRGCLLGKCKPAGDCQQPRQQSLHLEGAAY